MALPVHSAQVHQNNQIESSIDQYEHVFSSNTTHASYCYATFKSEYFNFKCPAILDTGSSVTLIPHTLFKSEDISKLSKTDVKITGVSPGYSPILGKIDKCDV